MTDTFGVWITPHGKQAVMLYRVGTSDWNTISSVMAPHDEYALPADLTGWAADIGSHVGSVAIALALDNPGVRVLAVEPVPDNARLLRANVAGNELSDRITVIENAAGLLDPVTIWWGYRGNESAEHHAYIGNNSIAYEHGGEISHEETVYPNPVTLSDLVAMAGEPLAWVKIDAEGAEWDVLRSAGLADVLHLTGEYHPVRGHRRSDLAGLLDATHDVVYPDPPKGVDPEMGPGPFVAVRR